MILNSEGDGSPMLAGDLAHHSSAPLCSDMADNQPYPALLAWIASAGPEASGQGRPKAVAERCAAFAAHP